MMKVYAVRKMVEDEYGCMETIAVYGSREDAEAWVAEHQSFVDVWYDEESEPMYDVVSFEVL